MVADVEEVCVKVLIRQSSMKSSEWTSIVDLQLGGGDVIEP